MTRFQLRVARLVCIGVLAGWMGLASAASAPVQPSEEDRGLASELDKHLARIFFPLPKDIQLDPALRAAGNKIAAEHLTRMKAQFPLWIQEERRVQMGPDGKGKPRRLSYAALARMYNELAFWQLEPGDAAYEQATLAVLKASPMVCRTGDDPRFADFYGRILRIQAMPAAQQQAALANETRLLERWGKPRADVLPRPALLPQETAMTTAAQLQAGGARPAVAFPPALAWMVLSTRTPYAQLNREARCALQQWSLQNSLAQGQDPATVLHAFRYGMMETVTTRFGAMFDKQEREESGDVTQEPTGYPKLAAQFEATGKTKLRRRFDAAGKPTHAEVIERKIDVRGIRGVRPIAFEDIFDARAVRLTLQGASAGKPGIKTDPVVEMVWSLDDAQTDSEKQATPQGRKP